MPLSPRLKAVNNPETVSPRLTESMARKSPPQTADPPKRSTGGSKVHQYHKSQSESVEGRVFAALTQSQDKILSLTEQLDPDYDGEPANIYSYTFDAK